MNKLTIIEIIILAIKKYNEELLNAVKFNFLRINNYVWNIFSKIKNSLNKIDCINSSNLIKSRGPDFFLQKILKKKKLYISNSVLSISGNYKKKQKNLNHNRKRNLYISYNGEIFNWQDIVEKENIKADNDTQMILKLTEKYKKANFTRKLFGMFATVLFDKKNNKIFFYCDPQGKRNYFIL